MDKNNVNDNFNDPLLIYYNEVIQSLVSRNHKKIKREFWLALYSLRLNLEEHVSYLVDNWRSENDYSYGIINWEGWKVFRMIFVEFLNNKTKYGFEKYNDQLDCDLENKGRTYIRLVIEDRFESDGDTGYEIARKVAKKIGIKDIDRFCNEKIICCYLGIVFGETSNSRNYPRYEIPICPESGISDEVKNTINIFTKFYFSQDRLSLNKIVFPDKFLKLEFVRDRNDNVPDEFLNFILIELGHVERVDNDKTNFMFRSIMLNLIDYVKEDKIDELLKFINSTKRKVCKYKCPCCSKEITCNLN